MNTVVQPLVPIAFEPADQGTRYEGWIAERMNVNVQRLLKLDLDMILDPFIHRPGPQWWAGEHVGKYLHAATHAWLFTGDDRLRARLDDTVGKLIATQLPDGYLGTYTGKDQFGQRDGIGWDGPIWDVWTHKYNLIGLLTYYRATHHEPALAACRRAADLMYDHFVTKKRSMRLASAHQGMAATSVLEAIALLYQLTGEPRYLRFCHVIIDAWEDESDPETWMYEDGCRLLTGLLEHGSVYRTANRKAYEMLSNLVGLLELYRVDPDDRYLTACRNAWHDISTKRLYITGTTSYFEHFQLDNRLPPGQAVGEGCVTVTWLQLTRHLLELTGQVQYADELERTTYNALLAAQSPGTGEVSYFTPLVGHKHYNGHDAKMTPAISCCSSSIPRGIAMIPTFASGTLNGKPALLQYIPGRHVLAYGRDRHKVTLHVGGDYPRSGDFEIAVELDHAARFALVLRAPLWASAFKATIDGVVHTPAESRLIEIDRVWSPGDKLKLNIPLEIRVIPHGDKTSSSMAFARGPQILATDTAIGADGRIHQPDWWGELIYTQVARQHQADTVFHLVNFADAGQNKEPYAVLHEGLEDIEHTENKDTESDNGKPGT